MYQKIKNMMIPKRTIIYMSACLFGLIIIVCIGIIPNSFSLSRLDSKISGLESQLEQQKQIHPVYSMLKNRNREKFLMALPFTARKKLLRDQIDLFPAELKAISKKAGMNIISISPDLNSLSADSGFFTVNAVLNGGFLNFRNLLIGICESPYTERVEKIQIRQNRDDMEFKIKIRLALA